MIINETTKANSLKWAQILRTNQYHQARGAMKRTQSELNREVSGYCCLGVAQCEFGEGFSVMRPSGKMPYEEDTDTTSVTHGSLKVWSALGIEDFKDASEFACRNDGEAIDPAKLMTKFDRHSFTDIANYIDALYGVDSRTGARVPDSKVAP